MPYINENILNEPSLLTIFNFLDMFVLTIIVSHAYSVIHTRTHTHTHTHIHIHTRTLTHTALTLSHHLSLCLSLSLSLQIASITADDIWSEEIEEKERSLWNARIFPVTTNPVYGDNTKNNAYTDINEIEINISTDKSTTKSTTHGVRNKNNYFSLFLLQYLRSYVERSSELKSNIIDLFPTAIIEWKSSKKLSLSDLLKYGDASKMNDWKKYIQHVKNASIVRTVENVHLSAYADDDVDQQGPSQGQGQGQGQRERQSQSQIQCGDILKAINVPRCQYGQSTVTSPTTTDVTYRLDYSYHILYESIRSVSHVIATHYECLNSGKQRRTFDPGRSLNFFLIF